MWFMIISKEEGGSSALLELGRKQPYYRVSLFVIGRTKSPLETASLCGQ